MRTWFLRTAFAAALVCSGAAAAAAQTTGQISGTVVDSASGQPLQGAQVSIPGTRLGATANSRGQYVLRNVPAGAVTVRAQRLGFAFVEKAATVPAGGTATVDFAMHAQATILSQVVAVGYGTERREQVTTAVSTVDAKDFNQTPARDAASLIAGKIPGLAVTTPSGDPTAGTEISLRGTTTLIGSTHPLVLVDGIPGDLNTVAPQDIQSISVLKDASAAAIYGSRASNGVILITTKQYEGGKPRFTYDGYASYQTLYKQPDFLTAADYRSLIKQGYGFQDFGFTTDWQKQVLRNPLSDRHNLSLVGGNENTKYTASLNYQDAQGIFIRSDNKTSNAHLTLDQTMYNGRVQAGLNMLSGVQDNFAGPDYNYAWRQTLIRNPTDRVTDGQGNWQERGTYFYVNPVGWIDENNGNYEQRDLRLNGTLKVSPIDNLHLQMLAGTDRGSGLYTDATTFKHVNTTQSGLDGTAAQSTSSNINRILELTGTYDNNIGRNDLSLLGGYSYQDFLYQSFNAYNYGFPTDLFGPNQLQQGSALTTGHASMGSDKNGYKVIGFFGRANYDWDNRFLLMGSVRYEGNSRFGAAHKWGMFPAVSAGWRLAQEPFIKRLGFVNELKLRAGYGVTGIAPTSSYLSLTSYRYGSKFLYNGQWVSGLSPARNPNPDLRWEQKGEFNVGVDYGLFDTRLYGSIDAYRSDNRNMLYNYSVPVPPYLYGNMLANVGHMMNKGLEAQVNWDVIRRRNASWTTSVNWSTNTNRLVSLSNSTYQAASYFYTGYTGEPIQMSTHRVDVGGKIGNFYGYKSVDIDSTGAWIVLDSAGNRISIRDAKEKDRHILGNGIPKQYLAWNNTARFHAFDLNVNMRGAFGFQILNFQRMFYENPTILQYNMLKSAFDKVYGKRTLNYDLAYVSYYIENGDYWKVDNVTLGYTVPTHALGALGGSITNARIYFSGHNLLTLTGYKGLDPEVSTSTDATTPSGALAPGDDNRDKYPTTRMFTAGVTLNF